jgi:hypothetical protein
MRLALVTLGAALLLGGCLSPAEREAAMDAQDNSRCVRFGAEPGTHAYTDCRMKLFEMRVGVAEAAADRAAQAQRDQMQSLRAPVPMLQPYAPTGPTNCTTNVYGQTVYTNCH